MERLSGRTAAVTGAGSGIGAVIARRLAEEGARVAVIDIDAQAARKVAEGLPGAIAIPGDVSAPQSAAALVEAAVRALGSIQILVNNAAVTQYRPALEVSADDWQRILAVNLGGPFFCSQAAARHMLAGRWGRIINISSGNSLRAEKNAAPYVASKGGLDALTRALAAEWSGYGVTVNAVAPGPVLTERTQSLFQDPAIAPLVGRIPAGAPITPADVAAAVAFLASPEAQMVTGHTMAVDGGLLAAL